MYFSNASFAVSESMASFLALEAMCQQESLSPQRTNAVLRASQSARKDVWDESFRQNPSFHHASTRRQGMMFCILAVCTVKPRKQEHTSLKNRLARFL